MEPKLKAGITSRGTIQLATGCGEVPIHYRERDSRDGRLLVEVDAVPLDAGQLMALAQALQAAEQTLAAGRRKYADMALTAYCLHDLEKHSAEQ